MAGDDESRNMISLGERSPGDPLKPGLHFELIIAVRRAMIERIANSDVGLLLHRFGIPTDDSDTLNDALSETDESRLIDLGEYLGVVETASDPGDPEPTPSVDAYTELVAAETALRDVIRAVVPGWQSQLEPNAVQILVERRAEEDKRRDGISVSQDLLDYTEIYQLKALVNDNWEATKVVLDDKKRTDVYLGIILDVRNTIGHSRPVVPSERLLLAGAAGQIRNQLARYRSSQDGSALHYSSIDSARDMSGRNGFPHDTFPASVGQDLPRVDVGDEIAFEVAGTDPRNRELNWSLYVGSNLTATLARWNTTESRAECTGTRGTLTWKVPPADVGEKRYAVIVLRNSSNYQRHDTGKYDDARFFCYHVNPPLD